MSEDIAKNKGGRPPKEEDEVKSERMRLTRSEKQLIEDLRKDRENHNENNA